VADVENSLRAALIADATVNGLVAGRVFEPVAPPGAAVPYVTYERISSQRPQAMGAAPGNVRARFQFQWVGASPALARALAKAGQSVLSRRREPAGTPVIEDIFLDAESQDTGTAPKSKRFIVETDYLVFYRE